MLKSVPKDFTKGFNEINRDVPSFDELPVHVIVNIFSYLSYEEKLQASTISQRFNQIIAESQPSIRLVLNQENDIKNYQLSRRYHTVELRNVTEHSSTDVIAQVELANPKELTLNQCIVNETTLLHLLNSCPRLRKLTFYACEIEADPLSDTVNLPSLPCLKILCLGSFSWRQICRALSNVTTLKKFYFKSPEHIHSEEDDEEEEEYTETSKEGATIDFNTVKDFIKKQRNLELLEVREGRFFKFPFELNDQIQLKQIDLFIPYLGPKQFVNLFDFMCSQKKIESCLFNILSFGSMPTLFHIIQLPTLKSLSIVLYECENMVGHFMKMEEKLNICNQNVEELQLKPCSLEKNKSIQSLISKCIKMFPNVKSLELFSEELMTNSAVNIQHLDQLKNLEKLAFSSCDSRSLRNLKLRPSVKILRLGAMMRSRQSDWDVFLTKNPLLKSIDVQMCMNHNTKIAFKLCKSILEKLQHLKTMHLCTCHEPITKEESMKILELVKNHPSLIENEFQFCGMHHD